MSTEANKVLVRRYREAHNTNNLALLDEVVAADIKSNGGMPGLPPGLQGGKMVHRRFLAAFPDGHVTTEDPRHKHRFAHAFTRHRQEGYVFRSVRFPHRKWQDCGTLGRT
jgi:SnoaL-like polyketide cyclase